MILQLDGDWSSHILVPAIHRNRTEIRDLFARTIAPGIALGRAADLAEASRRYLRERFLGARVGVSGANFGIAETGTICIVESEGNGRMCTTLPPVLVTVLGIEKLLPRFADLEVFLQLLPRSSTGERMNPYTSLWTGVTDGDGPQEFHVVLLDNGRTRVLADEIGRQALHCIRCSACLNVCPVYSRTGGHAYGSVYPGPIGAILTPQLRGIENAASLPFASTLCGACYEVCPVKIDIPRVLLHLRAKAVEATERRAEGRERSARAFGARDVSPGAAVRPRAAAALHGCASSAAAVAALALDGDPRPAAAGARAVPLVVEEAPVTSARDAILERVRSAATAAAWPVTRDYRRSGSLGHEERVARFCERLSEYRTTVRRAATSRQLVAEALPRTLARRPAGLPAPGARPAWSSSRTTG